MKKIISAILAMAICFALVGCDSQPAEDMDKTNALISGNNRNIHIAEDEDYIYFSDVLTVKKISKADNSVTVIYTSDETKHTPVTGFEYFDGRIYMLKNFDDQIISMDTDGGNIIEKQLYTDGFDEPIESRPSPYTYGGNLYMVYSSLGGGVYRVNPDTLAFEPADDLPGQFITRDGAAVSTAVEDDKGRIYIQPEGGEKMLVSGEDEWPIVNMKSYTDKHMFYLAWAGDDFTALNLYRVDLTGENKVLVKNFALFEDNFIFKCDENYIYLKISTEEYLKIHKVTLEETNIAHIEGVYDREIQDVADEKFFSYYLSYYIDTATGEKVEI